jgi:hypothetical protein
MRWNARIDRQLQASVIVALTGTAANLFFNTAPRTPASADRVAQLALGGEVLQDGGAPGIADEFAHPGPRIV